MNDYTTPHPDDLPVTRILAQIEAWAAFQTPTSTEVVLAGYLAKVGA